MIDKPIIIDGVDVSKCPAMDTYNIFGIEDKPCCYKFHEYCSAIPNCYFKQLKCKEQKIDKIKDIIIQCTKNIKCAYCKYDYECGGYSFLSEMILQIIEGE